MSQKELGKTFLKKELKRLQILLVKLEEWIKLPLPKKAVRPFRIRISFLRLISLPSRPVCWLHSAVAAPITTPFGINADVHIEIHCNTTYSAFSHLVDRTLSWRIESK